jgi:antitoxin PrlF
VALLQTITPVIGYDLAMQKAMTKLTSQGQVSVPAAVRHFLHLMPGAVLVWSQEGDRIVVERATRHSTAEVHQALFAGHAPTTGPVAAPAKTLVELKQGIRQRMQRRHAGR